MARPRKPTKLRTGNMTKEEKRKRQKQEEKLRLSNGDLFTVPDFLDNDAKREFKRVVKGLDELEVADNLDFAILAIYADAFSQYIKMTKAINKHGAVTDYTNAAGVTNKTMSAYVQVQQKYIDTIMKCSSKLGLAVSDRLKLIVPEPDESDDPLLKVLKA